MFNDPPSPPKTPFFLIATKPLDFEGAHRRYLKALLGDRPRCLACNSIEGVALENARTYYAWDGQGDDPNRPLPLCRPCAERYQKDMNDQWTEYYGGQM